MPSLDIDLDSVSGELDDRWNELSDLAIDPGGSGTERLNRRKQIDLWQARIVKQQNAVDEIKATKKAATVTVKGLSQTDVDSTRAALDALNVQIQKDQTWSNVITLVSGILGAANTVADIAAK